MKPRLLDLGNGAITVVDEDAFALLDGHKPYLGKNGYAYYSVWENGRSQPRTLHSLVMGGARKGQHIDHINGDKLDNRRENLRVVTPQRNQVNRKRANRNNTSGVRGVVRGSTVKPWKAQITAKGRNYYLGSFATKEEALAARRAAEIEHFGEVCP